MIEFKDRCCRLGSRVFLLNLEMYCPTDVDYDGSQTKAKRDEFYLLK